MLQNPNEALGEDDVVLDAQDFKEVAQIVWDPST